MSCICGGSGTIDDWNPNGDPCPECSNKPMTQRGQNNMTRSVRHWARHGGEVDVSNNKTGAAEKKAGKSTGKKGKK